MSVLACSRRGCKNVMCNRHSYGYGYICDECFEELVKSNTTDIAEFMRSEKDQQSFQIPRIAYEDIFPMDD